MKTINPNESSPELEERVKKMAQYMLALRQIQNKTQAEFISSLGSLSLQQLNVLNIVGDTQPCTMSDIAKRASLSLSSITLIMDKLVKAKLVVRTRTSEDRRIVFAKLSPEGEQIYHLQIEHIHTIVRNILGVLTNDEQRTFIDIFQKIAQSITQPIE